ncbi:protein serine/threonine phosphatase [Desulfarculus baarsii DSM 2075]|uniref:Protein serine/threonine phosphatase n=1 Tax=Desulfarculus baarsii (strain ATCC 33931 / DSM 2075 / LMG 7858 / VKM B-1802 / 2st14) TaxID=644282 RepID=E1QLV0_DESB2|nr:SpoIIE family protein phosphatase [Desulfarculus baarsii]ADK86535.1 protein serine/threonine phosphatase [Desulfarculus baarsii DSM 2075]
MRPRVLKLRSRFVLSVAAGVLAIGAAMGVISFHEGRAALLEAKSAELAMMAGHQAARVALRLTRVADRPLVAATALELTPKPSLEHLRELVERIMAKAPEVFGMAVAFAPNSYDPAVRLHSPYFFRGPNGIETSNLNSADYDYPNQDWYKIPALLKRPVWSEPYFDEGGGNVLMSTFSAPLMQGGQVGGVVTADVSLQSLERQVADLTVGRNGFAFVISASGRFLAAPKAQWVMRETIFSLAEGAGRDDLRALGKKMIGGQRGLVRVKSFLDGRDVWLAYAPVEGAGWSFGVVIPEDDVMAPVWELAKRQAMTVFGGLAAMLLVVWLLVLGLTSPLRRLSAAAAHLAEGDLATTVDDVRPGDEIGDLAESFNRMVADLRRHVEELTATTAIKERIQSELDTAYQIQQSILPRTYPAFPQRPEMDLFAKTIPAREVGGDFYDFFMLSPDTVGLVVGDVSGKGVPAALFMTVARTLIKNAAAHYSRPADVLAEVNAQIMPENEMCMFVTVFYGIYAISTGELVYTCAGHPAPMMRRADGTVSRMEQIPGMAVGFFEGIELEQCTITLEPGDSMLVFTDGLDESIDIDGKMFGMQRALDWYAQVGSDLDAPAMIDSLIECHGQYTAGTEKFDDLTMLFLRRKF